VFLLTLLLAVTGTMAQDAPADPEATCRTLRDMRPDGRSVAVQGLVLEYDVFRLVLSRE
jgi:hypothetical protein